MNRERWHTKEDVLKDLAEATGRRIRDLDEGYLIVGERPPPHFASDEDDEIQLQFHRQMSNKVQEDDTAGPDLKGITQMLRMVKEHNDSSHDDFVTGKYIGPSQNTNDIISISKLNPNTKEFIPSSARTSSPVCKNEKVAISKANSANGTTRTEYPNTNDATNGAHTDKVTNVSSDNVKKINGSKTEILIRNNEINDMATLLKNKICDAAKSNTFQVKREKNVAIATLLKLYSKSPDSESMDSKSPDTKSTDSNLPDPKPINRQAINKPVKLYTPQFFENCQAKEDLNGDILTEQITNGNVSDEEETTLTPNIDECLKLEETKVNKTSLINDKIEEAMSVSDPEMQNSIDKVDKWLNNEPNVTKPKGPAIFLGPIAFKRKEPTPNCLSPTEIIDKKIAKPGEYKPSEYAEELRKKYIERNKAKAANVNIWTKLENYLKEK